MSSYKTATIFIKHESDQAQEQAKQLVEMLKEQGIKSYIASKGYECTFFESELGSTAKLSTKELPQNDSIAIVLGGDGTLLSAARCLFGTGTPLLGINQGHLGFLTETDPKDAEGSVMNVLNGEAIEDIRPYFTAKILRNGKVIHDTEPFINDAVIQRNADERMLRFSINVGGKDVTSSRADGLIVSTPTGSTAYSLSSGGPIMHQNVDAMIISPICPHTLSFRPLVVPTQPVVIRIDQDKSHLSLDGRKTIELLENDEVHIEKSEHTLKLIHHHKISFYELLRHKLGWDLNL